MRNTKKETGGTSFHGVVFKATPSDLRKILGVPVYEENDGSDKVNMEWNMQTETGKVFTVYDWKEYRPLMENDMIEWHIGGFSKTDTEAALCEIKGALMGLK